MTQRTDHLLPWRRDRTDRFGLVLATVVVTVAWTAAAPTADWSRLITLLLQAMTVITALRASAAGRRVMTVAWTAWGLIAVIAAITTGRTEEGAARLSATLGVLLVVAALVAVLHRLAGQPEVTWGTVEGAIAAYLLIGLVFTYFFVTLAAWDPTPPISVAEGSQRLNAYLYFSFITLTTVGFGDVVPVSDAARAAAMVEALFGQLYLVTVVAVAVTQAQKRQPEPWSEEKPS